jgi:hypothetical protein
MWASGSKTRIDMIILRQKEFVHWSDPNSALNSTGKFLTKKEYFRAVKNKAEANNVSYEEADDLITQDIHRIAKRESANTNEKND